jgi:hypothetical protein
MSVTDASVLRGKIAPARGALSSHRQEPAKVRPLIAETRQSLMGRLFRRPEPTIFQRCLAVHIHHASDSGGMH